MLVGMELDIRAVVVSMRWLKVCEIEFVRNGGRCDAFIPQDSRRETSTELYYVVLCTVSNWRAGLIGHVGCLLAFRNQVQGSLTAYY